VILAALLTLAGCSGDASAPGAAPASPAHEAAAAEAPAGPASTSRNPFGVPDVPQEYLGDDVARWSATVDMPAAEDDPNAERWALLADPDGAGGIDGRWAARWNFAVDPAWREGLAEVRSNGDRVFILFTGQSGVRYLVEAGREGDRLVGAYQNLVDASDAAPWTGRIVGDERIDGTWPQGRWDFRRRVRRDG
jgi:hypothetical protein